MVQGSSRQGTSTDQEKITQSGLLRQTDIERNGGNRSQTRTRLEGARPDRPVQDTPEGMERLRFSNIFRNAPRNFKTYSHYCEQDGLGLFRKEFREAPRRIQITISHTGL